MIRNASAEYSAPQCCGHAEEIAELRGELAGLRARVDELARATAGAGEVTPAAIRAPSAAVMVESRHEEQPAALMRAVRHGGGLPYADCGSPEAAKITLYRALLAGREDVYAYRWENAATGEKGWAPRRVPDADRLGEIETAVLDALDPPLNLRGRPPTPIRTRLAGLRRSHGADIADSPAPPEPAEPRLPRPGEPSLDQAERRFHQGHGGDL